MFTQHVYPSPAHARRAGDPRWLAAITAVVVLVMALVSYRYATAPSEAIQNPALPASQPPLVAASPAFQGTLGYIRAHEAVRFASPDAATLGVMGYIRAHEAVRFAPPDAATLGVMGYIRAHGNEQGKRSARPHLLADAVARFFRLPGG